MDPFYIGKGHDSQYQVKTGRSKKWNEAVSQHGFIPVKICFWETEKEAYDHEEFLITCFRSMGYELCNIAAGGINGLKGTKLPDYLKDKIRQKAIGRNRSEETKKRLSEYNSRPDIKEKIAARFRGIPKVKYECKYCNGMFSAAMLNRWHNENCKSK